MKKTRKFFANYACFFPVVRVIPIEYYPGLSWIRRIECHLARFMGGKLLSWADPEGGSNPIWSRCILGIGKK